MGQMQTQVCVVSSQTAARRHVKEQQGDEDIPSGEFVNSGWDMAAGRWSWGGSCGPLLQAADSRSTGEDGWHLPARCKK
mgnify:CR=1 FL=1